MEELPSGRAGRPLSVTRAFLGRYLPNPYKYLANLIASLTMLLSQPRSTRFQRSSTIVSPIVPSSDSSNVPLFFKIPRIGSMRCQCRLFVELKGSLGSSFGMSGHFLVNQDLEALVRDGKIEP